jgi:hypothetical protein
MDVEESATNVKRKITTNLQVLTNLLDTCNHRETLDAVSNHISSAVAVIKASDAYSTTELSIRKRPAPNENSERQLRFCSTKKKRSKSVSLSKPTPQQQRIAEQNLQSTDICVCSICFKVDDNGVDEVVKWTQCSQCSLWYHCICVGVETDNFICMICCDKQPV